MGSVTPAGVITPARTAGLGKETMSALQIILATPSKKRVSPNVRSSGSRCDVGYFSRSGRSRKRSSTPPSSAIAMGAMSSASQKEPDSRYVVYPTYAPSMKSALCAKLMTSMRPKTSVRPVARRMRLAPTVSPMSTWVTIEVSDTCPSGDRPRPSSRQLAPAVGMRDVLHRLHHDRPQRLGLHDADVLVLDRVVVLGVEAQRASRAVELCALDPLDELVLVRHVA